MIQRYKMQNNMAHSEVYTFTTQFYDDSWIIMKINMHALY